MAVQFRIAETEFAKSKANTKGNLALSLLEGKLATLAETLASEEGTVLGQLNSLYAMNILKYYISYLYVYFLPMCYIYNTAHCVEYMYSFLLL